MATRTRKSKRAADPHERLGPDPTTIRNPNARPASSRIRAYVPPADLTPPRIEELPWPALAPGQCGWVADVRGLTLSEIGIAVWQIWHRCRYVTGQRDQHAKVLEVPLIGAPTREAALEQVARRMVGFAVAVVEVYQVDRLEPQRHGEHGDGNEDQLWAGGCSGPGDVGQQS